MSFPLFFLLISWELGTKTFTAASNNKMTEELVTDDGDLEAN